MSKATILIVEDEAIVAADLAGMLGRLGYGISGTTPLGEDAISLARERRPDLVLMDVRLAGAMDGVEAAGIIHRELDLPVIFLTAHSDHATLERAKLTEPFGYLLKPFEEFGLETHIEMALYKHRAEQKLRQAHDELELRVEERNRELRDAEQELRVINETLERRVAERTAELQAANTKLLDSRRAALNMMEDADIARRQSEETNVELQREVTERKQAEADLRESELFYRQTLESIPAMVFTTRPDGYCDFQSQQWVDFTGVPMIEHLGDGWNKLLHPDDRPRAFDAWYAAVEGRAPYNLEYRVRRHDGAYEWFKVHGRPIRNEAGEIVRWFGTALNIDHLIKAEEELRHAKEEWERTFNSVPDLIAIIDDTHRVVRVNKAMADRLGREPENCVGMPCYEAVHGANLPPDFCPHSKTLCDGGEHNVELHEERLGGDYLVTTTPLLDSHGRMTGTVHVARDITERKQAEAALKRSHDEMEKRVEERTAELRDKDKILLLQSRQAAMGEMIGNIAHQWRQPLNALGLTIQRQLLFYDLGEFTRESLAKDVGISMELIQHMSKTIDDFRDYFKPDKDMVEFNVREAVENALSLLEGSLQNPRISVEIAVEDDMVICGYQNEFAQVLLNIIINARDALTEREIDDPRIMVTICCEDGCAVLTIADNAGGISKEIIGKIFDPYFTTKGPQHGTGVGLFMSKAIIEKNMGGKLSVRNSGNGAEFRIEVSNGVHI